MKIEIFETQPQDLAPPTYLPHMRTERINMLAGSRTPNHVAVAGRKVTRNAIYNSPTLWTHDNFRTFLVNHHGLEKVRCGDLNLRVKHRSRLVLERR